MWVSDKYYLKLVEGGTPRGFWSNRTGASGGGGSLESTPGGHRQSRAMLSKKTRVAFHRRSIAPQIYSLFAFAYYTNTKEVLRNPTSDSMHEMLLMWTIKMKRHCSR